MRSASVAWPVCRIGRLARAVSAVVLVSLCWAVDFAASTLAGEPAEGVELGSRVADFELTDFRGRKWSSEQFREAPAVVVAFWGTECPLAKLYVSRLVDLQAQFAESGVVFLVVNPNVQDSLEMMAAYARRHQLELPFLKDPAQQLADALGATRTPEVCLLDAQRRLVYRGRIDDQYGIGYAREAANKTELVDALRATLAGEPIAVPLTQAEGCLIGRRKPTITDGQITYAEHVAHILQRRCTECHRDGDIGPMDLTSYEEVAAWSDMILEVIDQERMPPWHASPKHGQFVNDRRMPSAEREQIEQWVRSGAPLGDVAMLPEPAVFAEGWQLPREPDLIIPVSPQPFKVPATGVVQYQYFKYELDFDEDKWIKAAEIKPGNRSVVHHILVFDRPKGSDGNIQAQRGFLLGYVPGTRSEPYPAGMAKRLPAGSELIFQVHYTPVGTEQLDQSQLGIIFADPDEVLTHEIQTSSVYDARFRIPPGASDYPVSAKLPQPLPACQLLSMSPHMHVRGKSFRYTALFPNGDQQVLLDVPNYDFNWQTEYRLADWLSLPAGTQILGEATFDNSDQNLNNPDSKAWVTFGEQTFEEMMIGYFHVAVPIDPATGKATTNVLPPAPQGGRPNPDEIFNRLDRDGDGRLTPDEIPERFRAFIEALDSNGDGVITRDEFRLPGLR